jgi:hypothetical protein
MLEGKATWQLDQAPAKMFLRLFWFTRGKGTEDIEVISETVFDHPLAAESLAFQCPDMSFEKIMARFKELKYRVDGAEQLSWLAWKLFCLHTKNARAVIITSFLRICAPANF